VAFFEPPPPPPEPDEPDEEDFEQPEWLGPPGNVLGTPIPLRAVLARTETAVVAITNAVAYENGFSFELLTKERRADRQDPRSFPQDPIDVHFRYRWQGGELPDELLRFGVELADGRKATTLDQPGWELDENSTPEAPLLSTRGGGGGMGSWQWDFWLWPLPPPGPLSFVCEWPAKGIPLTRHEIDAGVVLEAARTVETLWDEPGPTGGGTTWTTLGLD